MNVLNALCEIKIHFGWMRDKIRGLTVYQPPNRVTKTICTIKNKKSLMSYWYRMNYTIWKRSQWQHLHIILKKIFLGQCQCFHLCVFYSDTWKTWEKICCGEHTRCLSVALDLDSVLETPHCSLLLEFSVFHKMERPDIRDNPGSAMCIVICHWFCLFSGCYGTLLVKIAKVVIRWQAFAEVWKRKEKKNTSQTWLLFSLSLCTGSCPYFSTPPVNIGVFSSLS